MFLNLCEANIKTNLHKIQNDFDSYKIEVTKQSNFTKFSRSCLMIHDDIDYVRRYDLKDDETSNVWIEIKTKNKKIYSVNGRVQTMAIAKKFQKT